MPEAALPYLADQTTLGSTVVSKNQDRFRYIGPRLHEGIWSSDSRRGLVSGFPHVEAPREEGRQL